MHARSSKSTLKVPTKTAPVPEPVHDADKHARETGHFLYQIATAAAILVFLFSFWA